MSRFRLLYWLPNSPQCSALSLILIWAIIISVVVGCGGSDLTADQQSGQGSVEIRVLWPEHSRFIHSKADRVLIEAWINDSERVQRLVIERPMNGGLTSTDLSIPSGPITIWMSAFKQGEEIVLSQAKYFNVFLPGLNDPISIDLISKTATIDVVRVPQKDTYLVGDTFQLIPTARNAEGSIILNEGQDFEYSSDDPSIASVSSTGLVSILAAGDTQLSIFESGTGLGGKSEKISATLSSGWSFVELPFPSGADRLPIQSLVRGDANGTFGAMLLFNNVGKLVVGEYPYFQPRIVETVNGPVFGTLSTTYAGGLIANGLNQQARLLNLKSGALSSLHVPGTDSGSAVVGGDEVFLNTFAEPSQWIAYRVVGDSYVKLSHPLYQSSHVFFSDGSEHVGHVYGSGPHASVWQGESTTPTLLSPESFDYSLAYSVHNGEQGGIFGKWNEYSKAALWRGSADTFVNLHPTDAIWSSVETVHGGYQAGSVGVIVDSQQRQHAALWNGTAQSYINLEEKSPIAERWSQAIQIWTSGSTIVVFGEVSKSDGHRALVVWIRK